MTPLFIYKRHIIDSGVFIMDKFNWKRVLIIMEKIDVKSLDIDYQLKRSERKEEELFIKNNMNTTDELQDIDAFDDLEK